MKTPVCAFDLKSGVLCQQCESKLSSGLISKLDINLMRLLLEEEKQSGYLRSIEYVKAVDVGSGVILLVRGAESLENRLAATGQRLSRSLGRPVHVLLDSRDAYKFYGALISPARLLTVNKIWLPDGTEEIRLVVDDLKKLRMRREEVEMAVKALKNVVVRIDQA